MDLITDGDIEACKRRGYTVENFKLMRELVVHEDNLINYRTTWTLLFHGLLFTAFITGIGLFDKYCTTMQRIDAIIAVQLVFCALGLTSAVAALLGVGAAETQLRATTQWWANRCPKVESLSESAQKDLPFPPVHFHRGQLSPRASYYFLLLAAAWLAFGYCAIKLRPALC